MMVDSWGADDGRDREPQGAERGLSRLSGRDVRRMDACRWGTCTKRYEVIVPIIAFSHEVTFRGKWHMKSVRWITRMPRAGLATC